MLNLVDLAGSERLARSGATGERLKETQVLNTLISCTCMLMSKKARLESGEWGGHLW